jgi:hypothetical protein
MVDTKIKLDPVLMGYIPPAYAHMIKADPHRPGPARARLIGFERPIWGIIQSMIMFGDIDDPLEASEELIARTAEDYDITVEAVRAALAYYQLNRGAIDAKIATDQAAAQGGRPLSR